METFNVLTFNAGLFRRRLLGRMTVPFVEERFAALAPALAESGADIILLQEVFEDSHRYWLTKKLASTYEFSALGKRTRGQSGHGLLMFSKYPLIKPLFVPYERQGIDRAFFPKGTFLATTELPRGRFVHVASTHQVAGFFPGSPWAKAIRRSQGRQLMHVLSGSTYPHIMGGDLNCGPDVDSESYKAFRQRRFIPASEDQCVTWDPKNPLNATGAHRHCPPQQCDHIFYKNNNGRMLHPLETRTVFTQPVVETKKGLVTLSDHYGLMTTFQTQ